ncbi:MAG: hypothetical protein ACRCW3_02030 [Metamycoplasmataceae bacterium]
MFEVKKGLRTNELLSVENRTNRITGTWKTKTETDIRSQDVDVMKMQGPRLTFCLGCTGVPNFFYLGAPAQNLGATKNLPWLTFYGTISRSPFYHAPYTFIYII